ncbi:hypothetical protein HPB49_006717 [Dermacentor silvarum]|uniref:Uncharacterized protein n=1 Tax=Dermacentor silvarum TaxID=543639 RepID=A0ACB8DIL8_DERSI|nr:hypothetical protein HPB49_006717 [Dermacentor silvarum]
MEAHNYVTSGLVEPPKVKVRDGNVIVIGKVRHSQAFKDKPLMPWLLIKADGEVLCAHCTCMAGLGEYPKLLLCNLRRKQCPSSWEDVQAECRDVLEELSIEPDVCALIEKQTKAQSASEKWHQFRTGRITASNAGAVFATSLTVPSRSLLKRLC